MKKPDPNRWKPVLRDDGTYCSPACGCKCTRKAYDEAVEKSIALAARCGKGWQPRVWENAGWHYSARFGRSEMHERESKDGTMRYDLDFKTGLPGEDMMFDQTWLRDDYPSPEEAMNSTLAVVALKVRCMHDALHALIASNEQVAAMAGRKS